MPPLEFVVEVLGYGLLLPAAVAVAALLLALSFSKRPADRAERLGGALALSGGFAAGFAAFEGSVVSRTDPWFWLPLLALLAVVVGLSEGNPPVPRVVSWGLRALLAGLTGWLLVPAFLEAARSQWLGVLAALVFILWSLLAPLSHRQPGGLLPLLLSLIPAVGGVVLEASGNLRLALLSGVLAGTLGGCTLISWRCPQRPLLRGMIPGFAVLLPSLLFLGYFYIEMLLPSFLLVAVAPLFLWVGALLPRTMTAGWRMVLQTVAVLVPLAVAVVLAMQE
jgi:hypothetical protein